MRARKFAQGSAQRMNSLLSALGWSDDEEHTALATKLAEQRETSEVAEVNGTCSTACADIVPESLASLRVALYGDGQDVGADALPPFRGTDGSDMPAPQSTLLSEASLRRFLARCNNDVQKAAEEIRGTLEWRRRVLKPVQGTTKAAALLAEGVRFRRLGFNQDGDLILAVDALWGHFEEGTTLEDLIRMCILGAEAACVEVDADETASGKFVVVAFGGPLPYLFSRVAARIFSRHYPKRLRRAVVYPVPSMFVIMADAFLYFVPERIRKKISLVTEEDEVVSTAKLRGPEQLPHAWRGGITEVEAQHQPDTSLLNGIICEYLNPMASSGDEVEQALEGPWEIVGAPKQDASGNKSEES